MFDPTVFLGITVGVGLLVRAIGVDIGMQLFFHPESLLIVLGGTFGATLVHFPISQFFRLWSRLRVIFSVKSRNYKQSIDEIIRIADIMRKDGPLALEKEMDSIKNHFLKEAISFMIDNMPQEQLEHVLEENIEYMKQRHELGIKFFEQMAKYAPGFGLIGTLIGLIMMLSQLEDPSRIGPNMAVALITTFYGVLLSNLLFLPLAGRLRISSHEEEMEKQMLLEGIMSMVNNDSNFIIRERMSMLLPQKEQLKIQKHYEKKA